MTKTDSFLRIFEAIPGTLKRFETLYNVETMKVDLGRNVGLVVSLWRFVVSSFCYGLSSSVSARRFLKSTRRITSWIRRLVPFVVSSFRHVVPSFRHVVSSFRYGVSTRPVREAKIRRTLHELFTRFHALIHDVFIHDLLCADL